MTEEQFSKELEKFQAKPIFEGIVERIDAINRMHRAKWLPGDLKLGGDVVMARSQGHDDIRALLTSNPVGPEREEPESKYREPEM